MWDHPWIALSVAIAIMVGLFLAVRALWRAAGRVISSLFTASPRAPRA